MKRRGFFQAVGACAVASALPVCTAAPTEVLTLCQFKEMILRIIEEEYPDLLVGKPNVISAHRAKDRIIAEVSMCLRGTVPDGFNVTVRL
jgi:hypothetical protein